MADRGLFIGFGTPVRGREERAVEVFGQFVEHVRADAVRRAASRAWTSRCSTRTAATSAGSSWSTASEAQCASAASSTRSSGARASTRGLIVEDFGVVPAATGAGGRHARWRWYTEAVQKVGAGGHALAAAAHNGG